MSITKYPMTVQGAKALEEEHAHLTKVVRPKLSQDIGTARELGDLKENAEYHAAREQQGMVEARIRDIEGRMQNAVIIDVTTIPQTGKVIFGTTVEIANVETDESVTYQIVGEDEADFKLGKISVGSPAGPRLDRQGRGRCGGREDAKRRDRVRDCRSSPHLNTRRPLRAGATGLAAGPGACGLAGCGCCILGCDCRCWAIIGLAPLLVDEIGGLRLKCAAGGICGGRACLCRRWCWPRPEGVGEYCGATCAGSCC
jgi:transcription elongation factor GreA